MIRAHQHAAGASGSDAESEALGYSKGEFSTKIHLRCEGNGKPVTFLLTVGQRNEAVVFESLMEQGQVNRLGPGRPRLRPDRVAGDKAYTGRPIRLYLQRRGIGAVIPRRSNESRQGTRFDRQAYRERNRIERTINRLKQFRRIATRYEKRAQNYLAMLTIAAILLWLLVLKHALETSPKTAQAAFGRFWMSYHVLHFAPNVMRSSGSITLLSGSSGRRPLVGYGIWSSLHSSIESLIRPAALELAPIRVNAISPGGIGLTPDLQLAHHAGQPIDVAKMAIALMTNPAVTNTVVDVDSGERLGNWSGET